MYPSICCHLGEIIRIHIHGKCVALDYRIEGVSFVLVVIGVELDEWISEEKQLLHSILKIGHT